MIDDFASCVQAAGTQARICTLFVHASSSWWTLRADDTFGPARWRRTKIALKTRTYSVILDVTTLTVRSAGRGCARILLRNRYHRLNPATDERIAYVSCWTRADGNVIHHVASRVLTAYAGTRIFAFVFQTSFVARTFGIENALGTTAFVRIAEVLGQAFAFAIFTYCVRTAWG